MSAGTENNTTMIKGAQYPLSKTQLNFLTWAFGTRKTSNLLKIMYL